MSRNRPRLLPPPLVEPVLTRTYAERGQKGGTLIAEAVGDLATHREWMAWPDRYRPSRCARVDCGGERLHVHQRRERRLRGEAANGTDSTVTDVLVFICASCGATWRLLPLFIARCLWRSWSVVERETFEPSRKPSAPIVPARTVRRWRSRLRQSALLLVQLLAANGEPRLRSVAQRSGLQCSRLQFVERFAAEFLPAPGAWLAQPAALTHRLAPGGRLM